jgi:hypothetical protein
LRDRRLPTLVRLLEPTGQGSLLLIGLVQLRRQILLLSVSLLQLFIVSLELVVGLLDPLLIGRVALLDCLLYCAWIEARLGCGGAGRRCSSWRRRGRGLFAQVDRQAADKHKHERCDCSRDGECGSLHHNWFSL